MHKILPKPITSHSSNARMAALRVEAERAGLEAGYSTFVWADGPPYARAAIVGEAPGAEEARDGKPFVGRAGKLLRAELVAVGLNPEDCWITNVVKHRPTKGPSGRANRAPSPEEIAFWLPFLVEELAIVNPRRLLCLGGVAAKVIIPGFDKMRTWRGRWVELPSGIRAMATYHPSYVLRALAFGEDEVGSGFRKDLAAFEDTLDDACH